MAPGDHGDVRGTYRAFPGVSPPRSRSRAAALGRTFGVLVALAWLVWVLVDLWTWNTTAGIVVTVVLALLVALSARLRRHGVTVIVSDEGLSMPWRWGRDRYIPWTDVRDVPASGRFDEQLHVVVDDQRIVYVPAIPPSLAPRLRAFADERKRASVTTDH